MIRWLIPIATHALALGLGFAAGIYALPILTAPPGPDPAATRAVAAEARYTTTFVRDLPGSDPLHWGEGTVSVTPARIAHTGRLAPGPDYKLYLAPEFVDTKAGFLALKSRAQRVGDVKTFDGFLIDIPPGIDIEAHTTVVVWCEAFSQFITAGKYR